MSSKSKCFSGTVNNNRTLRFDRDAVWLSPPPFQSARRVAISEDEYQRICEAWPDDLGVPLSILWKGAE